MAIPVLIRNFEFTYHSLQEKYKERPVVGADNRFIIPDHYKYPAPLALGNIGEKAVSEIAEELSRLDAEQRKDRRKRSRLLKALECMKGLTKDEVLALLKRKAETIRDKDKKERLLKSASEFNR